jgi:hypothetical protein
VSHLPGGPKRPLKAPTRTVFQNSEASFAQHIGMPLAGPGKFDDAESSAIIPHDVRRFSYLISTDQIFGTHTWQIGAFSTRRSSALNLTVAYAGATQIGA